jgi:hypothetical protein
VYFGDSPTFQRNIAPLSSGPKSKQSKKLAQAERKKSRLLNAGLLLGLLFEPEDGGDIFLRNLGGLYLTTRRYKPGDRILKK